MSSIEADAERGLTAQPKDIPPKWFYDDRGSVLFDEITRVDEYYPTRTRTGDPRSTRRRHRARHRRRHARRARLGNVGEDARAARRPARRGIAAPVRAVRREQAHLARRGRRDREGVRGDRRATGRRRLHPRPRHDPPRRAPARRVPRGHDRQSPARKRAPRSSRMSPRCSDPDDYFLLGTDLVKDEARLVAAYDDAGGVTAEFNKNVLHVMNRELGADFDVDAFEHVADLRHRARVDRDAAAFDACPDGAGARARPRSLLRRGRGDAHRGERQVHAGAGRARARRGRHGAHRVVDRPAGRLRPLPRPARWLSTTR